MDDTCRHERLEHWTSSGVPNWTHTGKCKKCGAKFGPFVSWESVRIAAGRAPAKKKYIVRYAELASAFRIAAKYAEYYSQSYTQSERDECGITDNLSIIRNVISELNESTGAN